MSTDSRPAGAGLRVAWSERSGATDEGREFLRDRISLFGKVVFFLCFGFYVLGNTAGFLLPEHRLDHLLEPSNLAHLSAAAMLLVMWQLPRRMTIGTGGLHALDSLGSLSICTGYALMVLGDHHMAAQMVVQLAAGHTLIARGVVVPSTALRTFWISSAGMAIGILATVGTLFRPPLAEWIRSRGGLEAIYVLLWSAVSVALATVASRVVYGLQAQVRAAQRLGQYTLESKIGEGGMGEVYMARHAMLRRPTAIKLVPPERAGEATLARFEREVQLTSRLTHPNTISIFDYGRTPDGVFYYAMEYLEGHDLDALVRAHGPQPVDRVIGILEQVCGALAEAHAIGLIHRDVKPANVILCERGGIPDVAKVVDFGLVKQAGGDAGLSLSGADTLTGTPLYMSPEMISRPEAVDGRADLYALGAVAYWLLTGQPVFEGASIVEICGHHLHSAPVPPSERAGRVISAELERTILDCLAKDPKDRPCDALDLRRRLRACPPAADWDEAVARAWWREHRAADIDRAPIAESLHVAPTIDVDLDGRWSVG